MVLEAETVRFQKNQSEFAGMLKALGHPVRLELVRQLLYAQCCCCGELCDCFEHSQSTVSQHLSVLKDAGLIIAERNGTRILYSVHPEALEFLARAIADLQSLQGVRAGNE